MNINILIVDDFKPNLYYVETLLRKIDEKFRITMAQSGEEALKETTKKDFDLILLDIQMPDMDGFEMAQILKANPKTESIPIVFLTASATLKTKGLELGAVDYLTKPIDNDLFISRISLYVRLVRSIRENRKKDRQMQQQARLAQMGEMISMIAHQWRQPLAAIAATSINVTLKSEFNVYDLEKKEEAQEYEAFVKESIEKINEYVQSLTATIDDFRNFYKPNKQSVAVKLEDVILKSLSIIKISLQNENIEITEEYNSKEVINLHDNEMMQVILNILKNSQDNFKEKNIKDKKIHIKTEGRTIYICDNGGGIPEDIISKIFDPYFSTKSEKNGSGLGLYMSKTIIENHHHGKLDVFNKDDGVCFEIELGEL